MAVGGQFTDVVDLCPLNTVVTCAFDFYHSLTHFVVKVGVPSELGHACYSNE